MLVAVETAVAMGNAVPEVKAVADYVTDDVAHDGDLAVHPAVVDDQLADVLEHQLQEFEQGAAQFSAVFGEEFEFEDEALGRRQRVLNGGGGRVTREVFAGTMRTIVGRMLAEGPLAERPLAKG